LGPLLVGAWVTALLLLAPEPSAAQGLSQLLGAIQGKGRVDASVDEASKEDEDSEAHRAQ